MRKNNWVKYCFGFIIGLTLFTKFVTAQQDTVLAKSDSLKSLIKLTVGWRNGFEWEKKISKLSVLDFFGGINIGLATDDFKDLKAPLIISPSAFIEYRNYYNLFRRIDKRKKTRNNSANFFYGTVEVLFPVRNQNFVNLLLIQGWGAQRSFGKRMGTSCHVGVIEHFFYDRPPNGGFNYMRMEPDIMLSFFYVF